MRWFANELGYGDEADYWAITGLLHDIDFEQYPEEHCVKAPELLREAGVGEDMIHSICSHGYGICCDVEPELEMEKGNYVQALETAAKVTEKTGRSEEVTALAAKCEAAASGAEE